VNTSRYYILANLESQSPPIVKPDSCTSKRGSASGRVTYVEPKEVVSCRGSNQPRTTGRHSRHCTPRPRRVPNTCCVHPTRSPASLFPLTARRIALLSASDRPKRRSYHSNVTLYLPSQEASRFSCISLLPLDFRPNAPSYLYIYILPRPT
jgi:hypothetical protein